MGHKVSVIIPCYQQGATLAEAVESVQAQSHYDCEIIIINDGSTDTTAAVAGDLARRFPDSIRVIHQANQGQQRARQRGLDATTGEFCVTLDADDLLEPRAAELCLKTFAAHPEADAVVGDALITGPDGAAVLRRHTQSRIVGWPEVLAYNPYGVNLGVMTRTASLRAAGGLAFEHAGCEDWDTWARMTRLGMRFVAVHEVLGRYRQTGQNHSRRVLGNLIATIAMLDLAAAEDPRLAGAGRPAAPPITPPLYQRYRNGRVFHALGLALGCGLAADGLLAIAALLVSGAMKEEELARQFGDGMHFARMQPGDAVAGAVSFEDLSQAVKARLDEIGQGALSETLVKKMTAAARPGGARRSPWQLAKGIFAKIRPRS